MKSFIEFLIEMPHIVLDNGKTIDLELEVHDKLNKEDFFNYINKWLNGELISSKSSGFNMSINKTQISNFAKKLTMNYFFRSFVIKLYGESTWLELLNILVEKIH